MASGNIGSIRATLYALYLLYTFVVLVKTGISDPMIFVDYPETVILLIIGADACISRLVRHSPTLKIGSGEDDDPSPS